ncbi:MAG: hypothetical protein JNK87_02685 [Bryobacterales bacterium]|nr:hypothetical protein [Bryobacterales bacterium]
MRRRSFLTGAAGAPMVALGAASPVTAAVRAHKGKPTLFVRDQPVAAMFYALTDAWGGRWSYDETPRLSLQRFVKEGFRLFQVDLFLEDCWPREDTFSIEPARRQIRGVLDLCPDPAVVLRWHVNAPGWWNAAHPDELTRYANGDFEPSERTQPVRYLMDDLRRKPRASLASEKWMAVARRQTAALLRGLAATEEGAALAGVHVACGVYGEWHYWGFMRNEPDVSRPMQERFAAWRNAKGREPVAVPGVEERRVLDDGIFRDPARRQPVIDYYRCQQELVAERIVELCGLVKRTWPRPLVTGTFYGYFFSMFDRQATGGHLCLDRVLASPDVDYLSAPQAYGAFFRDMGGCGISRGLTESVRLNGKLFLDEMDQTPSWTWRNDVDTAFKLNDVEADYALLRRNVFESFTRGAGLWYYDFGPANQAGWWLDDRLMAEIGRIRKVVERYHERDYVPAGDVLFVFDTEVFYYTGSIQGTDKLTDVQAVNRTIGQAWRAAAALETVHLRDLEKLDLRRFKLVVFANTWLMTAGQRRLVRERVMADGRHVLFQGVPGYCDGVRLDAGFSREVTGLDLRLQPGPLFTVGEGKAGLSRHGKVWFATTPLGTAAEWREVFREAGAHLYVEGGEDVVHAGAGLVLVHSKEGGARRIVLRGGRTLQVTLPAKSSWVFDARSGERAL